MTRARAEQVSGGGIARHAIASISVIVHCSAMRPTRVASVAVTERVMRRCASHWSPHALRSASDVQVEHWSVRRRVKESRAAKVICVPTAMRWVVVQAYAPPLISRRNMQVRQIRVGVERIPMGRLLEGGVWNERGHMVGHGCKVRNGLAVCR